MTETTEAHVQLDSPAIDANPIVVEVTRGPAVEGRHRGSAVVIEPDGHVIANWGNAEEPVFPRSAIKAVQAIPLIETGAADAIGLGDKEITLACASHNGEPQHVETVAAWLEKIGLGPDDLECGPHWPFDREAARTLAQSGGVPLGAA